MKGTIKLTNSQPDRSEESNTQIAHIRNQSCDIIKDYTDIKRMKINARNKFDKKFDILVEINFLKDTN